MEILTHLASFLAGLIGGSLLTIKFNKKSGHSASGDGNVVDQRNAKASGDIVGRDKSG